MNHSQNALTIICIAIGFVLGAGVANAQLPKTSVQIDPADRASVVIDPQVDFLSSKV